MTETPRTPPDRPTPAERLWRVLGAGPPSTTPAGPDPSSEPVPARHRPPQDDIGDFADLPDPDGPRATEQRSQPVLARVRRFGARHLGAIGVFVVVALVFCSVQLLRARTDEVPLAVQASQEASGTVGADPSRSGRTSSGIPSSTPAPLVVHVVGRVSHAGVIRLPPGSRVADAIAAAGGLATGARTGRLNLAEPLADGSQVVVGPHGGEESTVRGPGSSGGGDAGTPPDGQSSLQLDLNAATAEQFEALPGIGPVTARSIIDWRTQHHRFTSVDELQEVDGIGPKTFQKLAPMVRV